MINKRKSNPKEDKKDQTCWSQKFWVKTEKLGWFGLGKNELQDAIAIEKMSDC